MSEPTAIIRQFWNGFVWSGPFQYIYMRGDRVALSESCCCPCPQCDEIEVTITASYCNMTATVTVPLPGFGNVIVNDGNNYLDLSVGVVCGPCGWYVTALICRGCGDIQNSEGHFGEIRNLNDCTGALCPGVGVVPMCCDEFSECLAIVLADLVPA